MRIRILPVILLSLLIFVPAASAQMMGHGQGPMNYKTMLGLSDAQWAKLKPLQLDYKKATIMEEANIRIAEAELYDLADNRNFDLDKVTEKLKEIERLKTQLAVTRYDSLKKTGAILTDAQFEKLVQMIRMAGGPDAMGAHGPMAKKKEMMKKPTAPANR